MTEHTKPSLFSQYVLLSISIPGLFAFAVMMPYTSPNIITENLAWVAVFLIAFSFVLGAFLHIASVIITERISLFITPDDLFKAMIIKNGLQNSVLNPNKVRSLSSNEMRLLQKALNILDKGINIKTHRNHDIKENIGCKDIDHDVQVMYTIMLTETWSNEGPVRLLFNIRMMCQSLLMASIFLIPTTLILSGLIVLEVIDYSPMYATFIDDFQFIGGYIIMLISLGIIFGIGQRIFSEYFLLYMLSSFMNSTVGESVP